jgi:hypothetical protein
MRRVLAAAFVLATAGTAARAAPPLCLQAYRIDHTDVPDDGTILFHMRDHSVYRAHMIDRCVGLSLDPRGFTYEPNPGTDEICANLLTITLNTTHQVCLVGAIEKVAGPH